MLLRMLVSNYVRQAAQQKILEAVSEANRTVAAEGSDDESADQPHCGVAVIFGLGVESGGLVDLLQQARARRFRTHTERLGYLDDRVVLVAESGAGAEAAGRATVDIITRHRPTWVVGAGFASSLEEETLRGNIVLASSVLTAEGEELPTDLSIDPRSVGASLRVGRMLSTDRILRTPEERRELGSRFAARAADMESFAIGRVCRQLDTKFLAIKIVTEPVDHRLPREMEILLQQKSIAGIIGAAAGALLSRPSSVKQMWQLKEEALIASDRLAKLLQGMLEQLGVSAKRDE